MRTELDNSKQQKYIDSVFSGESELLLKVRAALREDKKEGINIGANEARILQSLIALGGIKKIVEVGCLYGYSALWMANALPEDGTIYTLELDANNARRAQSFFDQSSNKNKITLIEGPAEESLSELTQNGPFDMVFIDANKAAYVEYLNWAIENVKTGGLIVGDNTFLFGHVYQTKEGNISQKQIDVMTQFNKIISDQHKFFSGLIPTSEGMTIAVKK